MALIQHWKLDDNAASATVVATVGTDGTLGGGDNTSDKRATGAGDLLPYSFLFNGTDDYVDVSASSISFADGTAFSVSIWVRHGETTMQLLGQAGTNTGLVVKQSDTTVRVYTSTGNTTWTVPAFFYWTHILITRDTSNNMRVFMNGVESSSGTQARGGIWAITRIACGGTGTDFGTGRIASVGIYDSDESANVATIFAETKVMRHWPFTDNAASTVVLGNVGSNAALAGGDNTSAVTTIGPGQSLATGLRLNGVDDHITLGSVDADHIAWGASTARSASLWFRVRRFDAATPLIGETAQNLSITSQTNIRVVTSAGTINFTVPSLEFGEWYHLLVTRTAANGWRLWLDGTESTDGEQSLAGNFSLDYVGRFSSTYARVCVSNLKLYRSDEAANVATLAAENGAAFAEDEVPLVTCFRVAQSASAGAVFDATVSGIGKVKAAMVWGNNAVADNTAANSAQWSWGFATGDGLGVTGYEAQQVSFGQQVTNGLTTSTDGHRQSSARVHTTGTGNGMPTLNSAITVEDLLEDTIKFRQATSPGDTRYLHGMLFSGPIEAKLYVVTLDDTEGNYVDVPIDFEPSLLIASFQGDPFDDYDQHTHHAATVLTFIKNNKAGTQTYASYSLGHQKEDAAGANNFAYLGATYLNWWDVWLSAGGNEWEIEISFPDANTMRVKTVGYGNDSAGQIAILALDADWQIHVGMMDVGTGTGSQTPTITPSCSFTPNAMLALPSHMTATATSVESDVAGTSGIAAMTRPGLGGAGDAEFCSTQSNEQGASPTNTQSLSDDTLFNVPLDDGSTGWVSSSPAFVAGGISHTVGTAPGTTVKVPVLFIGEVAESGLLLMSARNNMRAGRHT